LRMVLATRAEQDMLAAAPARGPSKRAFAPVRSCADAQSGVRRSWRAAKRLPSAAVRWSCHRVCPPAG
jgi:hypothetical protein